MGPVGRCLDPRDAGHWLRRPPPRGSHGHHHQDMYDRIQFQDVDGGAWKQGWEFAWKADEWNAGKLNVLVASHFYNDHDWIHNVDELGSTLRRHESEQINLFTP
ncbi:hypothetical protein QYE76_004002 [Lolium multiflorum]|uniref:Uncharacterized protein n=1 Tax=Lolium multiflorum TaxID=4521 RepID=A0AAD8VZS6_LOLMU|nr:hypothetical protein QYE76_004002 [Lolium multiflorum]